MDRLLLGALAQFPHQVERQRYGEFYAPGPAGGLHQPPVGGTPIPDIEGKRDDALGGLYRRGVVLIDLDRQRQELLVPAAQHGKRTVAGAVDQRSEWSK